MQPAGNVILGRVHWQQILVHNAAVSIWSEQAVRGSPICDSRQPLDGEVSLLDAPPTTVQRKDRNARPRGNTRLVKGA